ncbi:MAG: molecular chaperone TorD family protein [Gammaproteobacteria bacterium]|nr:molecular chaperone TorD family protein [Gammaproteobacteria bacterium]
MSAPANRAGGERHVSPLRDAARTAPARCRCYGIFSELVASPHDVDVRARLSERLGAAEGLPFGFTLDELVREHADCDPVRLGAEYSGLFEVGSQGPPAPIREDLGTGQKAGTREDIVRFYDYFGYRLAERFAWAPDHLSVELEFMHYLAYHEASAGDEVASYQLAQLDFAERHLANWVAPFAAAVARLAPGSFYARVLQALADFVTRDLAWQRTTIQ